MTFRFGVECSYRSAIGIGVKVKAFGTIYSTNTIGALFAAEVLPFPTFTL